MIFPIDIRSIGQVVVECPKIKRMVSMVDTNFVLILILFFHLLTNGETDLERHIVSENCSEALTGGYDTSANQIVVCQNRVYT